MLSMLISLSTVNDAEVRQYAAFACVKIAQNADVRDAITEAGGLEPVLYLARTDELEIQRQVLPALCCLSFHDSNKVPIVRYGGLEPVVRSIRDNTVEVARLACCCIANLAEMAVNFDLIHDSGAIGNLAMILSSPSDEVKRESARALGNLSANIELGDVILREGALPHLIPMLRSPDYLTQRMAAMALCNLSSNIRNQSYMLSEGLFDPLLHETKLSLDPKSKSDHECTRYCLLTLANLAVNPVNQKHIMKYALPTLSAYSKHRDIKCRHHAVFCLGNLCSNLDNLEDIVSSGVLKTLVSFSFESHDKSTNVQFQAVAALRGLATHPILRVQILRENALEPLIMASRSPSIEVQREAAAAICNLAISEENKVILARGGALPILIALAGGSSGDEQREMHAVCALANIAEMVEGDTQGNMIREGVLKVLIRLSDSKSTDVRQQVARSFALFASKRDSHEKLVSHHVASKMLNFMSDSDTLVQRFGVLGLGNLAVSRESHQELFDVGAVAVLMDLSLRATDLLTKRVIAFSLHNIACNPANHIPCDRLGLTRALLLLLSDNDKDVNFQAILATRHLCESAKFRNQFIELNGIPVLLPLGFSEDVEVKREVCAALRNLSLSVHGKVVMVREKVLTLLCDCMQSPDVEVCHQSTGVVANLAEASENQGFMVEHGAIQHLKYVLRSKSIDVQREAARALANISAEYTCEFSLSFAQLVPYH
jgi:HEAT repeat protein